MPVQNRIVKVQKRNRALVRFDPARISKAMLRAAQAIGGFQMDFLPGINDKIFSANPTDEDVAAFLADAAIVCLNSDPHHLISNFPPRIETIQDEVLHTLRSYGFQRTADAYECYRWGRHWLREGAITQKQFAGSGFLQEHVNRISEWNQWHGVDTVAGLNVAIQSGRIKEIIAEALAAYDESLVAAAQKVVRRLDGGDPLRMIWISGPSSSGKTTTAVKLTAQLNKQGLRFLSLNLDDYFWSSIEHPTDWLNDRNYETPEALDIQLLNEHLRALLEGKTIEKPIYSFKEGRRVGTKQVKLEKNQVLLLDCLHGFYPPISDGIESAAQFRIYIDTMNVLYEGDGSGKRPVQSTDIRLIRRMLRDVKHRNHGTLNTILHWHYVRYGEMFSIVPLMGLADHVVNGGLPFDLPALKPFFIGNGELLPTPDEFAPYAGFLDARIRYDRVKALLESVTGFTKEQAADLGLIPGDAVIREFIGGSTIQIPHNE
jgi:uridine kinase